MTIDRAALLRNVAQAIIESGYAVSVQSIRTHTPRQNQMRVLAFDSRIDCSPYSSGRAALIEDVMSQYRVSRGNARLMIHRARKMRNEWRE